ncbi:response regulator [Neptunitalea chrysea]|uniref:Response regulator n=1 Tax=Neptunitalea chrysea TaxID=1647581 RepID=A0A9W6B7C6_9FLAO|nr:response regulator [Neptunitalea chrysea]GLB52617.1 response regulator [Neptunitalea chrysea]
MKKINLACIIDDDPIFVFGIRRIMEMANFCNGILIYNNGKEALDALTAIIKSETSLPELILLDINMPIMDGWGFLDRIMAIEIPKPVTIYIVSSSIDPTDFNKAEEYSSVSNFIVKPVTVEKLKHILKEFTP